MKIVKISDMSEEEKKKFLEKQQERAKVKEQNKVKAQEFKNVINKSEPKDNSLPVRNNTDTAIKRTSLWEDIQNIANGSGKIADNLWQGLKNGVMSFQQTVGRTANNTQADSIDLINKMNKLALESRLKDNPEEAKQISNIINNPLISGDKIREESKEYYNKIQERKNENSLKIQQNTESISNPVGKYIAGEIAPSIGQMLPGMIGGPLGATYFIGSATGNYYDDALQRGMTENQATMYSGVMGIIEGSLEDIGAKLTTKVGKQLLKRNVKGALVSYGLDIGENFLEESVVEPISELVSSMTAGKDKANWNDIGQRMWESGVAGAVTSIITGGTSAMIGGIGSKLTQQNQYVDYNTNKKLNRDSQNWLKQAENIIQENKSSNLQQNTTNNQNITQEQQITSQENKTVQNGISEQANNNYMSAEFKKGLEKFKSGNYNQYDNIVILNETPQWLYNKGFDYEQPIVLNMDKLSTIMKEPKGNVNGKNQHGITMDIIKQLPEAISNPLNVIKNPKYNNRYVIITNLTDQYGDIVIVPIEMNTKGYIEGIRTDINRTSTVYGKENYDLPKSNEIGSYMERNKNNIVYDIDTYNNRSSNVGYRLQLPSSNITTSNNIIPPTTGIVNSNTNNSIQNAKNNSISSSFDKNAKRYEDLLSANIINYNKRANGMLNVEILNNNELINQITVNSKEEAIKQLGNNIGTHIYETANEKSQILNLTQQEKVKQEPTTHKEKQLEIINTSNPMLDDYHTGIRSVEDIKAFQEVIANDESFTWGDFSKEDAEKALKKGKVTIYSSYPIEQGVFVSTSKIQAEEYAGGKGSKVYSKTVPLDEVAWINGDEGQYAKVPFRTSEDIANDTKISDLVANNQETLYNNSNESESGYNEFTNKERYREEQNSGGNQQYDKRRVQELFEKYQTGESAETSSSGQYETKKGQSTVTERQLKETLINYAEKYKKSKLNNNEQKLSNIVQKLGGNVIFYEYGKDNLFQGLSNTNTFYIDTLGNENTKNVFYHELTHFLRQNNNSIYMNEIQPIVNEIAINYDYQEIIYNYAQTVSESLDVRKLNGSRQLELAEEIVADQMANFYGDLPVDYGLTDEMKTSLKNSMDKILNGTDNTINNNVPPNENPPGSPPKSPTTRHDIIQKNREIARENIENISTWKDKSNGLKYQLETMERNMYDIIPDKAEAKRINDTYFEPIHQSEADKQKFINKYNDRIREFKLNKYESEAVQLLGEQKYNPSFNAKEVQDVLNRVNDNINKGKVDKEKVDNAIETFRGIYDELFELENKALRENGYQEKPYRKGYFPHFIDYVPETKTEKVLNALGFKIDKRPLPTDIAGITEQFVPGKTWNKSALERKTNKTDYNALKGFDTYISQAADNIFHTENIQRLRGLENEIRYQYSDKGIQKRIDEILNDSSLYQEEKQDLIDKIFEQVENPMPNLVTELRRYTNALANKKSEADRSIENKIGRSIYSTVNAIENKFGANAVGLNIGSAITNFIPITQAYSQISTKNMSRAMIDTVKSYIKNDGFIDNSTFLTNRLNQSEKLYKTTIDKISNKANFLFDAIDDVTSNIVVRGKYLENIENGMTEMEAMKNADRFAANVIADRSKGSLPTMFEEKNPVTKMFTQFQLEVNNQFRYMFKDLPRDLAEKGLGAIALAFFKMYVASWIYNKVSEKITGRKPAFSPIDLAVSTYKNITDKNKTTYEKIADTALDYGKELPFVGGLIGGGRVPVNGAIPNVGNLAKGAVGLMTGEMDSKKAVNTIGQELSKPLYYLLPPFGGAQLKKSVEGIKTVIDGGSYGVDNKGEKTLQFPVENPTAKDYIKAGIFGKYSLPLAQEYVDKGYKSLSAKQTKTYEESNLPYKEYLDYLDAGLKTTEDKINYLESKEMTTEQKWGIYKNDLFSDTIREKDGGSQLKDAEYITSNGVSKSEYMKLYNKAKKNEIDMPTIDEYKEMKSNNIVLNDYIDYKIKIKQMTENKRKSNELSKTENLKNVDKIQILLDSNYSDKEISAMYAKYIKSEKDTEYDIMKATGIDIKEYLKYKQQEFASDVEDDGTLNGKTISKSKQKKVVEYLNSMKTKGNQRLLLYAIQGYSMTASQKTQVAKYVNELSLSKETKLKLYDKFTGFTVYKNGRVEW